MKYVRSPTSAQHVAKQSESKLKMAPLLGILPDVINTEWRTQSVSFLNELMQSIRLEREKRKFAIIWIRVQRSSLPLSSCLCFHVVDHLRDT